MSYAIFKTVVAELETQLAAATADLNAIRDRQAAALGIAPRNAIGLTADAIKLSPDYRAASYRADQCFAALRLFNGQHAKRYAKEIRADIAAKRQANLAARA